MATNTLLPFESTHPGTLIKDELEVRKDITQKDLSILLGVKPSFLNEIIKGKRPVTADIAILLEKSLGIPADYWMKFQSQYEIDSAKIKEKNIAKIKHIETWNILNQYVPIKYFNKKGYLTNDLSLNISIIQSIYSIQSIDGLVNKFTERKNAFFKKSDKLQIDEKNLIAWTSLAEYEAERKNTNAFNFENLPQLINELREIFYFNKNILELVDKKLARYGIKFLLIDKLEKTPIDGYSFWSKNNPVIALTIRHNRIDNLAFTILHEIGHIALHLKENKEIKFLDFTKMEEDRFENEANLYAQKNLIPSNCWNDLLENYFPLNDEKIYAFSHKYRINPAITLGRACFEKGNYSIRTKIDKKLN
jgi:HTH-type transcriptional regulator/antitoxin HigA